MKNKKRQRASKSWIIVTAIVLVGAIFLLLYYVVFEDKSHTIPAVADTRAAGAHISRSEAVGGEGSPKYNQDLKEYGNRQAEKAEKNNQSYLTPYVSSGSKEPVQKTEPVSVERPEKRPQPAHTARKTAQPPTAKPVRDPDAERMQKAILEELKTISGKMVVSGHVTTVFKPIEKSEALKKTDGTAQKVADAATAQTDMMAEFKIKPGDVFYGVNRETLNSDVPGNKFTSMSILSGPLKGYRATGSFIMQDEYLVLKYTRMTAPTGKQYAIEAYAVDPNSKMSGGVRSDVDKHTFSRWVAFIGSSFLEGFGDAVANSGISSNGDYGDNIVISTPDYDLGDQAWIAAGKVGEKTGKKAEEYFDTKPTVTLAAGTGIGILFVDIKS